MTRQTESKQNVNGIKSLWNIPDMSISEVTRIPRKKIEQLFPDDPKDLAMQPGDGYMYAVIMKQLGMPQTAKACLEDADGNFYDCFDRIMNQARLEAGKGNKTKGTFKMGILLKKADKKFSYGKVLESSNLYSREIALEMSKITSDNNNPVSAAILIAQIQARLSKKDPKSKKLYSEEAETILIDTIIRCGKPEHAIEALFHAENISDDRIRKLMDIIIEYPAHEMDKVDLAKNVLRIHQRELPIDEIVDWIISYGDREDAAEILKWKHRQPLTEAQKSMLMGKQYETDY